LVHSGAGDLNERGLPVRLMTWRSIVCTAIATLAVMLVTGHASAEAVTDSQSHGIVVQALTITLPIVAGVIGYFIVYWNSWRLERQKAALKYVSDQLQFLYGPLFALNMAGGRAVTALSNRYGQSQYFFEPGRCYTESELREYRLWMTEVFMPINLHIEKTITGNGHLIEGSRMPD
jgi:hypothetical protein